MTRELFTIADARRLRVTPTTRTGYNSKLNQIEKWLVHRNKTNCLNSDGRINLRQFCYDDENPPSDDRPTKKRKSNQKRRITIDSVM